MIALNTTSAYTADFLAGVFAHLALFRIGEWDLYTTRLLGGFAVLNAILTYSLPVLAPEIACSYWQAFKAVSTHLLVGIFGIYTSIVVYRAAFHRLNRFPGPFAARLSNFYVSSLSVKRFHLYEEVQTLHKKYGDIVRLGETPRPQHDVVNADVSGV